MSTLRFLTLHLVLLAALAATAFVTGELLLRLFLGDARRDAPARIAWSLALGLFALATIGMALGAIGRLEPVAVAAAALALHLAGWGVWHEAAAHFAAFRATGPRGALALGAAILALPSLVLTLYPPLAFDETLYHLPFSRTFLETGSLPFVPELRFPVFPAISELLGAELLAFGSDAATHFVAWIATFVTAALLWSWGRRMDGGGPTVRGALAAALWLGQPLVTYLSGTAYVEPLLALFVTASAYALWLARSGAPRIWLALSGLFAGAAAATKYQGLFFVAAFALIALTGRPATAPRRRFADFVLFSALALAALAPSYGRIIAHTGNPVFPFLSGVFGENEWTPKRFRTLTGDLPPSGERWEMLADTAGRLATLPWDVVARRERVGALPPLSPVYLLALPLLPIAALRRLRRRRRRRDSAAVPRSSPAASTAIAPLVGAVLVFIPLTLLLPPDVRYLVPALPVLGLAIAAAVAPALTHRGPRPTIAIALLVLLPGWAYGLYRLAILGCPPASPEAREAFLEKTLPYYSAVEFVNQRLRPGERVYGLDLEEARYYVRAPFDGEQFGPRRFAVLLEDLHDGGALARRLSSWGDSYLIVDRGTAPPILFDRATTGLVELRRDHATLVFSVTARSEGE